MVAIGHKTKWSFSCPTEERCDGQQEVWSEEYSNIVHLCI